MGCIAKILVLNTGSSSVKFGLYDVEADGLLSRGRIEKLGTKGCFVVLEHYGGS
ncbi:hypothetical protein GOV07_01115, partial [Candidatus Woesearchaeota archaeon]|nr:hypothetical protein [Candidatus Woesearchaeota archaeon]